MAKGPRMASAMSGVLCFVLGMGSGLAAAAGHPQLPPLLSSPSWIVVSESGGVVAGSGFVQARPIASITKLAMAMAYLDARPRLDAMETISASDVDSLKGTSSRLPIGSSISRRDLLRLALASSENRAASAIARGYPGGTPALVAAMNAKAVAMGWSSARFVDPTGLSPRNVASAKDVALMARAALRYPEARGAAKSASYIQRIQLPGLPSQDLAYKNTNKPLRLGQVAAAVSKTGYTNEAGRCLAWALDAAAGGFSMALLGAASSEARDRDEVVLESWARGVAPPPLPAVVKKKPHGKTRPSAGAQGKRQGSAAGRGRSHTTTKGK